MLYEFAPNRYPVLVCKTPLDHTPSWWRRWFAYETGLECDLPDWEDRANAEYQLESR
jgi:hypothetical protein